MRWSLRLSEFDFEIEHVPGSKIKHVDALISMSDWLRKLN